MGGFAGALNGKDVGLLEIIGDVKEVAVAIELVVLVADKLDAWKFSPVRLVVAEDPIAGGAFFALKLRKETAAVEGVIFSGFRPGGFGKSGVEVREIDEVV